MSTDTGGGLENTNYKTNTKPMQLEHSIKEGIESASTEEKLVIYAEGNYSFFMSEQKHNWFDLKVSTMSTVSTIDMSAFD